MSQNSPPRKRRGRGGRSGGRSPNRGSRGVSYQSALGQYSQGEDAATFWARSNARLGIDPEDSAGGKRSKAPVEFACGVCGVFVQLERWPKDRQSVRCESCKNACGALLTGDDLEIASSLSKKGKSGRFDGLPEMTEEDLEAITEMKAHAERMGNGRSGNRKRGSGGGARKRRRSGHSNNSNHRSNQGDNQSGGGQRRRRRRRRGGRGEGGERRSPEQSSD
ncbi:MAG: hypothetical protein ACON3Z_09260 [Bradymonadia bacterium]